MNGRGDKVNKHLEMQKIKEELSHDIPYSRTQKLASLAVYSPSYESEAKQDKEAKKIVHFDVNKQEMQEIQRTIEIYNFHILIFLKICISWGPNIHFRMNPRFM